MKNIIVSLILLFNLSLFAQRISLYGSVKDEKNTAIEGVTVILSPIKKGTYTNSKGTFKFKNIKLGTYDLQLSYVGYATIHKKITLTKALEHIDIILKQQTESLEEVIVSYDKVKNLKKQKTVAIELVNQDFIQQNMSGSLGKTLEKIPGVSTISIGSGQSKVSIRGLSFNRVLVADKGLKHEAQQWGADHGLEIDQYAVKNIEVIKGPSSLSYGSDAIGGVINIKSGALPQPNSFNGEISSTFMSNNKSFTGSLFLNKSFEKWFVQGRITRNVYSDLKVPTDVVEVYNLNVPLYKKHLRNTAGNETNYHLNIGYTDDNFSSVLYGSVFKANSGFFANAHGLEPRRVDNAIYDKSSSDIAKPMQEVDHYKLINKTKIFFDKHTLNINFGVQQNIRSEKNNYVNHGFMPDNYPLTTISKDLERKFDKYFYALKAIDNFNINKHTFEAGIDANYQENDIDGWGFIIPSFKQFSAGAFAINKYKHSEKITFTGGLRYDFATIDVKQYTDWFTSKDDFQNDVYLQRVAPFKNDFQNVSFSLGMNYHLEHFNLKANIGNSFRMPIAKELAANGVNYHYYRYERGNKNLNPERSYQLDITTEWNYQNWAVQVSPFVNYFSNYIYLNPTSEFDYSYGAGNQIFNYTQSKVFRYGGEIHAHIDVFKNLQLGGSLEYVKARQLSGSKKGYGLPFSPPLSVLFSPKYSFNSKGIFLNPYISGNFRVTASQKDIVPPEEITKGYNILNLNAGSSLKFGHYLVDVSLQVQNVFNTKYFNHTNFYRLINLPEQGRNFVITTKLTF